MTGESVMVQPRVTPSSSTLFVKIAAVVRRLVAGLRATDQNHAIAKPFPFFGE